MNIKLKTFGLLITSLGVAYNPGLVARAQVDPNIHKLCVEAKDYIGCTRAMKGDTMPTSRVINSQGADIAEGNQCPASYAYVGGGNCQRVSCFYSRSLGGGERGHDPIVAGKPGWKCGGMSLFHYAGVLRLGEVARASLNPECPPEQPKIGYNNSCQSAPADWLSPKYKAAKEAKEGPKCDYKIAEYACSYNKYLEANPSIQAWADANPEMATNERIKLESVD